MSQNLIYPTDIEVSNSDQLLTIEWQDGHTSEYPLSGLRRACPCVVCKGGHAHMKEEVDMKVFFKDSFAPSKITDIQQIGTYAIQIHWEDGHNQGIWKWQYLRSICPCRECAPEYYEDEKRSE